MCQYNVNYFGDKVHVDQNKKLKVFGVTHVANGTELLL